MGVNKDEEPEEAATGKKNSTVALKTQMGIPAPPLSLHVVIPAPNVVQDNQSPKKFIDALPGHLLPDSASQTRLPVILSRIESISNPEPI